MDIRRSPARDAAASTEIITRAVIVADRHLLVVRVVGDPGCFLPGGHAEPGEPLMAALRRELAEELGATVEDADSIGTVEHSYSDDDGRHRHEINHVFDTIATGIPSPGQAVTAREDELEFTWLPIPRLAKLRLRPEPLKRSLLHWLDTRMPFTIAQP